MDTAESPRKPAVSGPVEPQSAKGPSADYCPDYADRNHYLSTIMRGGSLVYIRSCMGCGWVDFEELDAQILALLAKAIEWRSKEWMPDATIKHADDSTWIAEAERFRRVLAEPHGDD